MDVHPRRARLMGLLGSGEFEPWTAEADRFLLERSTGGGGVLLFATASAPDGEEVYASWLRRGLDHYTALGVPVRVANVRTREDALRCEVAGAIEDASLLFFSGGNPAYLAGVVRETPLNAAIDAALERGAAFAGCSAGACLCGTLAPESVTAAPESVEWMPGLCLIEDVLVVPHWNALDRYRAGQRTALVNGHARDRMLLGIDERVAALCDGEEWVVHGEGRVLVQEGVRWRRFAHGQTFRLPDALSDPGPLYHRTFDADRIMRHGFVDAEEHRRGGVARGVWLADRPLDDEDDIAGDRVIAVEIPFEVAAEYEWNDGGDRYREFCIPAGVVNRYAPFVEVTPQAGLAENMLPAEFA